MSRYSRRARFPELKGKVILEIKGMEVGSDEITFICADGSEYLMYHQQECCETVEIDDIVGDVNDLIGSPIIVAEENSNDDLPKRDYEDDSYTWTFYKLATERGYVDLKWYGTSNGYYFEGVDFELKIETMDDMCREAVNASANVIIAKSRFHGVTRDIVDPKKEIHIKKAQDALDDIDSFLDVCKRLFNDNARYGKG